MKTFFPVLFVMLAVLFVLFAPFCSELFKQKKHKWKLSPDTLMVALVTIFAISITSYSWLMFLAAKFILETFNTDFMQFLDQPITGKSLLFFATIVYSIYCGWNFLLYPLVRDFEQLRQEAKTRKQQQQHKQAKQTT